MNVLQEVWKALKEDKGRDVNRSVILVLVIWCATQLGEVKQRVVIIETRLSERRMAGTNFTDGIVKVFNHSK